MATYLVLGGTGKTGRRLARQLSSAGHSVRAGARTPGSGAPGVEPVRFDWDDDATWGPALTGADGAYLVPPALRTDHPPLLGRLAAQAADAGLGRLVLLSARGVDQGPANPLIEVERAVTAAAGDRLAVTVVRPSWFAQNATESFFRPGIEQGALVAPTGDGAVPWIDAEDIAAVAAAALTGDGHAGRVYELSGPRALTLTETAAVLAPYAGRAVRHVDLPVEQWVEDAAGNGLPREYAQLLGGLFEVIRAGHEAALSDGVQQALGRAPTSYEEWAAREAGRLAA
ncbi:Uncharacterized conserved protein YbjT, contains NAD(P)-binding and DUF2867 domains [Geodermatophilus obscurus]|uniref:Uncharacterized conserved protein YbjT, contains NAD(P)-binding and DUF2867 domains n=1 Tax=Geodermatophilus obscurus TaxID=1861 RepID=A0A1I5F4T1_9ACTN|nr:NAD(P)H-binding protein [Geodermatophilus obscurus]SFO18680.1 Uncharacterized conserved protein YbjT, contains NAD(P)-binding and DUF2867 domains [Geodermatophilus obscurus]